MSEKICAKATFEYISASNVKVDTETNNKAVLMSMLSAGLISTGIKYGYDLDVILDNFEKCIKVEREKNILRKNMQEHIQSKVEVFEKKKEGK